MDDIANAESASAAVGEALLLEPCIIDDSVDVVVVIFVVVLVVVVVVVDAVVVVDVVVVVFVVEVVDTLNEVFLSQFPW